MNSDSPNTADIVERLCSTCEVSAYGDRILIASVDDGLAYRNPDGPEAAAIITKLQEALIALNEHWNGVGDYDNSPDDEARLQAKIDAALKDHRKAQGT